jgi:hypothetical protein
MVLSSPLEFIESQRVRVVCEHWLSLLAGTALPRRARLDPVEMTVALPFVWIVEKEAEPSGRYMLRLTGEEVNRLFGESLRRRFIDEIFPPPIAMEVVRKFDTVVETPALVWTLGPFFEGSPDGPVGECAVLPLVGDDNRPALLGVTVPSAAMDMPPRRLIPIGQEKRILTLGELAAR